MCLRIYSPAEVFGEYESRIFGRGGVCQTKDSCFGWGCEHLLREVSPDFGETGDARENFCCRGGDGMAGGGASSAAYSVLAAWLTKGGRGDLSKDASAVFQAFCSIRGGGAK